MKHIKVLGTGCSNCKTTVEMIQKIATEKNIQVEIEKIEDIADIMTYGIMSTPGVVLNDVVVHAGGIPAKGKIEQWLASK